MVLLTLVEVAPIEDCPDKSSLADVALHLIKELQEGDHTGEDASLIVTYNAVEMAARDSLARAKLQEGKHQQSLKQEPVIRSMQGLEIEHVAGISTNENGRDKVDPSIEWVFVGDDNDIDWVLVGDDDDLPAPNSNMDSMGKTLSVQLLKGSTSSSSKNFR
ncbi:hypothetical protein LTS15_009365 [Exophiala xenobiotica]|nr:hypothetical protein LTS15_009365 [Exophiala xenobiotica]